MREIAACGPRGSLGCIRMIGSQQRLPRVRYRHRTCHEHINLHASHPSSGEVIDVAVADVGVGVADGASVVCRSREETMRLEQSHKEIQHDRPTKA